MRTDRVTIQFCNLHTANKNSQSPTHAEELRICFVCSEIFEISEHNPEGIGKTATGSHVSWS